MAPSAGSHDSWLTHHLVRTGVSWLRVRRSRELLALPRSEPPHLGYGRALLAGLSASALSPPLCSQTSSHGDSPHARSHRTFQMLPISLRYKPNLQGCPWWSLAPLSAPAPGLLAGCLTCWSLPAPGPLHLRLPLPEQVSLNLGLRAGPHCLRVLHATSSFHLTVSSDTHPRLFLFWLHRSPLRVQWHCTTVAFPRRSGTSVRAGHSVGPVP